MVFSFICPLCIVQNVEDNANKVFTTSCGHSLCYRCAFNRMYYTSPNCPICGDPCDIHKLKSLSYYERSRIQDGLNPDIDMEEYKRTRPPAIFTIITNDGKADRLLMASFGYRDEINQKTFLAGKLGIKKGKIKQYEEPRRNKSFKKERLRR